MSRRRQTAEDLTIIDGENILNSTISGDKIVGLSITGDKLATGSIDGLKLKENSILNFNIAESSVTTAKIAPGAVNSVNINDLSVEGRHIKNGTITTDKIASGISGSLIAPGSIDITKLSFTISGSNLSDGSITSSKLNPNSITSSELSNNSVTTSKIINFGVTTDKIAENSITTSKILNDSITTSKIAEGAITSTELSNNSVIYGKIAQNAVTSNELSNNSVTTNKIADDAITTSKIAEGAITSTELSNNSVIYGKIAQNAVTSSELSNNSVIYGKIAQNAVTSSELSNNSVIYGKIAQNAVTSAELSNNSVIYGKIAQDAVTSAELSNNSVTTNKIADNSITSSKIVTLDSSKLTGTLSSEFKTSNNLGSGSGVIADNSITSSKILSLDASKLTGTLSSEFKTSNSLGSGSTTSQRRFFNEDWNLLGNNITTATDLSGIGVLPRVIGDSSDGYTIAMGFTSSTSYTVQNNAGQTQLQKIPSVAVLTYDFSSNNWTQKGQTITLPRIEVSSGAYYVDDHGNYGPFLNIGDYSPHSSALNNEGTKLAISYQYNTWGSSRNQRLRAKLASRVYNFTGGQWVLQVEHIKDDDPGHNVKAQIALDGSNVKLFDFHNGGLSPMYIYTLIGSSFVLDSQQITETIINNALPFNGYTNTSSVTRDGKTILLQRENRFAIFNFNGTNWTLKGAVITITEWTPTGSFSNIASGIISGQDGNTFCVSNFTVTVNQEPNAGMTKVYGYDSASNTWKKKGQDIIYEEITLINEANNIQLGSDAKVLSGNGSIIILGTRIRPNILYNENQNKGTIQAYKYSSITNYWSKIGRVMTGTGRPGQYARINISGSIIYLDDESYQDTTATFNSGRVRAYEIEI